MHVDGELRGFGSSSVVHPLLPRFARIRASRQTGRPKGRASQGAGSQVSSTGIQPRSCATRLFVDELESRLAVRMPRRMQLAVRPERDLAG